MLPPVQWLKIIQTQVVALGLGTQRTNLATQGQIPLAASGQGRGQKGSGAERRDDEDLWALQSFLIPVYKEKLELEIKGRGTRMRIPQGRACLTMHLGMIPLTLLRQVTKNDGHLACTARCPPQ
jgi:hypothetical protein